jgi:hypothetical protein
MPAAFSIRRRRRDAGPETPAPPPHHVLASPEFRDGTFVIGRDLSDSAKQCHSKVLGWQEATMHILAVAGAICVGLYVAVRLTLRFYFPPDR